MLRQPAASHVGSGSAEAILGGNADEAAKQAADHLHNSLRTILEGLMRGSTAGLPDVSLDPLSISQ
jgi:hypothetical protein